jgi:long-chain acyl-CoA synthetase
VVSLVPTIVRMLLAEIAKEPQRCATLRAIVATGEAFPASAKAQLMALLPGLEIHSFYSQTEAGLVSSLRPEAQLTHPLSVGHVVPGVEVRIVDHDLSDVPPGQSGEILVRCGRPGQASVMRAYYNAAAATAAAFIEGWLRTGDVGRFDDDGYLYFVDRAKDMIISGGLNIYSKEVEIALASHPAVAEVAVIGVPDDVFAEAVMAFVELAADASVSADELVEHCRTMIASYKKPKYIRFVQSFPRSSTGKILKGELRLLAKGDWKPETKP